MKIIHKYPTGREETQVIVTEQEFTRSIKDTGHDNFVEDIEINVVGDSIIAFKWWGIDDGVKRK